MESEYALVERGFAYIKEVLGYDKERQLMLITNKGRTVCEDLGKLIASGTAEDIELANCVNVAFDQIAANRRAGEWILKGP